MTPSDVGGMQSAHVPPFRHGGSVEVHSLILSSHVAPVQPKAQVQVKVPREG